MAKKIICMLLALSMMLTMLAACNNEPVVDETPDDGQQQEDIQGNDKVEEPFDGTLKLVVDGVSDYVIVRGEDAYISEVTASTELQSYIKQISGVEIPIVTDTTAPVEKEIVVGKTNREADGEFDRDELGDNGLVIKTNGQKLFLVGGEQRGTLYSVYEFLEAYLGCRFYTSSFEKIPETQTLSLEQIAEDKQIPSFDTRETLWADYSNNPAFAVKRKINGRKNGPIPENLGGSDSWVGGFCHTMEALCGADQHTEQPCLTDEATYQTVLKNLRAWLASNPNATYTSVSQNDNHNVCYCDNCTALMNKYGSYGGVNIAFVNRLAEEIKDEYPNIIIHTFAYQETRGVPTGIKPADNVMVELCSIEGCFSHPLEECTEYSGDDFAAMIKGWAEICNTLSIWDYTTNYGHYASTFPNFGVLRQNMRLFADNNVKYIYEQGNYQATSLEFGELRGYLISKLMWDPYMSQEEFDGYMIEFCKDYYGPGWEYIIEYINVAEEESNGKCFGIYNEPDEIFNWAEVVEFNDSKSYPADWTVDMFKNYETVDWSQYWNYYKGYTEIPRIVTESERLFQEAIAAAETDAQRGRLEKAYTQVLYLKSHYWGMSLKCGAGDIGKMIGYFIKDHAEDLPSDLIGRYKSAIYVLAINQTYEEYAAFNRALAERCLAYGAWTIKEGHALESIDRLNFKEVPVEWYP